MDSVFKCIDELAVSFHTIDPRYIGLGAKEELGTCQTIINGRGVGIDCVGGNRFIVTVHIQCWVQRVVLPFEVCCRRQSTKLGSGLECSLDNVSQSVTKMWVEGNVVWFPCMNIAGMDCNAMCWGWSSNVVLHSGCAMTIVSKLDKEMLVREFRDVGHSIEPFLAMITQHMI